MWLLTLVIAFQNPVMPGDHPDPSAIRVGADYWAANTSSEWAPIFPLSHSRDLKTWRTESAVFEEPPSWAVSSFWAPELTADRGHFRVYYSARKRDGPLCVGVAAADKVSGPYVDHGPVVCQEDGSIDPFFIRDENGKPFLLWKEDGNSRNQPSILFAQPTSEDGLTLTGERSELIRNDVAWEGKVVEGADILRHGAWFYLFYAGGACCGRECNYGVGVARSRALLGHWEKDPANPIVTANEHWTCPGHGTTVKAPGGADYFLYHAYSRRGFVQTGREALLDRITWQDGWPRVADGHGPGYSNHATPSAVHESFLSSRLDPAWQWPVSNKPEVRISAGALLLTPHPDQPEDFLKAVLARPIAWLDFSLETTLLRTNDPAGLAIVGNPQNAAGLAVQGDEVIQWRISRGVWSKVAGAALGAGSEVQLRMRCRGGVNFETWFRVRGGKWEALRSGVESDSLVPWDTGLRAGIFSGGPAKFRGFDLTYLAP